MIRYLQEVRVPLVLGSRLVRKAILADIEKQCYTFALTKG